MNYKVIVNDARMYDLNAYKITVESGDLILEDSNGAVAIFASGHWAEVFREDAVPRPA
jgi:hypothetical protein